MLEFLRKRWRCLRVDNMIYKNGAKVDSTLYTYDLKVIKNN